MTDTEAKVSAMKALWDSPKTWKKLMGGDCINYSDPSVAGERFVSAMMERFLAYSEYCVVLDHLEEATILEIGCGTGRFLKPLAPRFKKVIGVDISNVLLESAKKYCASWKNIEYHQNDGSTLSKFESDSLEYVFSMGVFQHVTDFNVIASYIKEALRILKEDGLFFFCFIGIHVRDVGSGTTGAKITAGKLDEALKDEKYKIREVSSDSANPRQRTMVIVLQKTHEASADTFSEFTLTDEPFASVAYGEDRNKVVKRLTFYDK